MSIPARISQGLPFLIFLIVMFIIDDVLIYVLLKSIYQWQVSTGLFIVGCIVVLALNLGLAMVVLKVMRRKPTTGQEGMVGKRGVAMSRVNDSGKVKVQGEIWSAESQASVKRGEQVVVDKVEGLTLHVSPIKARN